MVCQGLDVAAGWGFEAGSSFVAGWNSAVGCGFAAGLNTTEGLELATDVLNKIGELNPVAMPVFLMLNPFTNHSNVA